MTLTDLVIGYFKKLKESVAVKEELPECVRGMVGIIPTGERDSVAVKAIDWLLALFKVADCGTDEFKAARNGEIDDYEDAVVVASAQKTGCDYIVTRNTVHFRDSPVPVMTPADFATKFGGKSQFAIWK